MGSTSTHRAKGITTHDFFAELLAPNYEIVASSTKGGAFYAATRHVETGVVDGFVAVISWGSGYYNFTYKDMDERMGPGADEAPAKVLDALSPTTHEYALEWRARCRANLARRAASAKITPGTVIRFPRALTFRFNGDMVAVTEFTFEQRNILRTRTDGRFRVSIPNWRTLAFEVVEAGV
jgi:hypothetical protein